jgi:hypothetical protein
MLCHARANSLWQPDAQEHVRDLVGQAFVPVLLASTWTDENVCPTSFHHQHYLSKALVRFHALMRFANIFQFVDSIYYGFDCSIG